MAQENYPFGIAKTNNEIGDYADKIKLEYDLDDDVVKRLVYAHLFKLSDYFQFTQFDADIVKRLVYAHLFKLSDYFQFTQFDADIVLYDEETGYYATGDFEPCEVKKEDVIAIVDENSEYLPI